MTFKYSIVSLLTILTFTKVNNDVIYWNVFSVFLLHKLIIAETSFWPSLYGSFKNDIICFILLNLHISQGRRS